MTDLSTIETMTDVVDTHLAAYCEPDAAVRAGLVARIWSPEGRVVDPPLEGAGLDGIAALGDVVVTHYPGHTFRRTTAIDEHHGFARYGWALLDPDGATAITGTDVATFDSDGRLVQVVGFFGDLAAAG
jgi:hypothetical protein